MRRLVAGIIASGVLLVSAACTPSVDPIERLGRKAAQKVTLPVGPPADPPADPASDRPAGRTATRR